MPEKCFVCGAPAQVRCSWPTEVQVEKPILNARAGDVWITQKNHKRGRIAQIIEQKKPGLVRLFQIWIAIPGHKEPYPYPRFADDTFTTVTEAPCGNPACDNHVRDLDGSFICSAHWREQLLRIA